MDIRKNLSLILGLSIPVVILIVIAIAVVVPRFFTAPTINFLYTTDQNRYYYGSRDYSFYTVEQGKIALQQRPLFNPNYVNQYERLPEKPPNLYLYDVTTKRSREISYEDALELSLDINATSPDGFRIENGGNRGLIPEIVGGNSNYGKKYLVGHGARHDITLINAPNTYNNFSFLGWILP